MFLFIEVLFYMIWLKGYSFPQRNTFGKLLKANNLKAEKIILLCNETFFCPRGAKVLLFFEIVFDVLNFFLGDDGEEIEIANHVRNDEWEDS